MMVTHYSELYGANRVMLDLIDELMTSGINFVVILPKYGTIVKELERRKIEYVIYDFSYWASINPDRYQKWESDLKAYSVAISLSKEIINHNIQIVHTNSSVIHVGALAAKLLNKPHVWHIREFLTEDYNLQYYYGKKAAGYFIDRHSNQVICVSGAVKSKYINYINETKLITIYDGVNEAKIQIKDYNYQNENIKILLVGLLHPNKGQKDAILAIERLVEKGIKNISLLIVGDGPFANDLKKLVINLKLDNYVNFLGYISNLNDIRANCDIALMCSKNEAFGLVTIEAMLAKLPVIGACSGGTVELIEHEKSGLHYEVGNIQDLANKIEYLIKNPVKRLEFAENGYQRAVRFFTIRRNAKQIMNIYQKLIKEYSN